LAGEVPSGDPEPDPPRPFPPFPPIIADAGRNCVTIMYHLSL
jgi:hypothetical protein